jgi:hypothetical protein
MVEAEGCPTSSKANNGSSKHRARGPRVFTQMLPPDIAVPVGSKRGGSTWGGGGSFGVTKSGEASKCVKPRKAKACGGRGLAGAKFGVGALRVRARTLGF